jgi:hypothetical protein
MTSPTTETKPKRIGRRSTAGPAQLSLARLHLLRFGYLVFAVGLAVTKWPLIVTHDGPWPLFEGVETCMLVALSLLSFLGLRYPIKMLPILLFEIGWKLIWLTVIAAPLLIADEIDPATSNVLFACVWVVIVLAVIPWRYVVRHYVLEHGDPWRPDAIRSVGNQP